MLSVWVMTHPEKWAACSGTRLRHSVLDSSVSDLECAPTILWGGGSGGFGRVWERHMQMVRWKGVGTHAPTWTAEGPSSWSKGEESGWGVELS